jgi:hypothetical protein
MTQINLYPLIIATKANPIPVFPDVPSTIVPPGFSHFQHLQSFYRHSVFYRITGIKVSTLASTNASTPSMTLFNFTNVFPIVPKIFSVLHLIVI